MKSLVLILLFLPLSMYAQIDTLCYKDKTNYFIVPVEEKNMLPLTAAEKLRIDEDFEDYYKENRTALSMVDSTKQLTEQQRRQISYQDFWRKNGSRRNGYIYTTDVVATERDSFTRNHFEGIVIYHGGLKVIMDPERIMLIGETQYDTDYPNLGHSSVVYTSCRLTFSDDSVVYVRHPYGCATPYPVFVLLKGSVMVYEDDFYASNNYVKKVEYATRGLLERMLRTPLKSIAFAQFDNREAYIQNEKGDYNQFNSWVLSQEAGVQLMRGLQCIVQQKLH